MWGATARLYPGRLIGGISIHAPRVGSDTHQNNLAIISDTISIHAPRVGSDPAPVEEPKGEA